jgi:hypothetical protein
MVRLIDENWPECPIKEVRLSDVLHAVLGQASALMNKEPPESCLAAKQDLMRKLFVMKILVGKFLVVIRWYRKFLKDIRK